MKRPIIQITLLVSFLVSTAAARVIGEDDRYVPNADEADFVSALGLIVCTAVDNDRRRRSAGTGTIVGSRSTILTSAHILTDDDGPDDRTFKFDALTDCVFRQYDSSGNVSVEVRFTHVEIGEFWENPAMPNHDWAVLKTATPLPETSTALPFAMNGNGIDDVAGIEIRILAFHADIRSARRSPRLSDGTLFGIDYGGYRRLAHTADTGRMSSGAAIVHQTEDGQNIVVGVNRSSANFGDFNLAVPLSIELRTALNSFAYGQVPIRRQRLANAATLVQKMSY
jgi:hypothetical protein